MRDGPLAQKSAQLVIATIMKMVVLMSLIPLVDQTTKVLLHSRCSYLLSTVISRIDDMLATSVLV